MSPFYSQTNFDDLFRDYLKHGAVTPPPDGWERVEKVLLRQRRLWRLKRLAYGTAALLLGGMITLAYWQFHNNAVSTTAKVWFRPASLQSVYSLMDRQLSRKINQAHSMPFTPVEEIAVPSASEKPEPGISSNHSENRIPSRSETIRPALTAYNSGLQAGPLNKLNTGKLSQTGRMPALYMDNIMREARRRKPTGRGFEVGLVAELNNTWILREESKEEPPANPFARYMAPPYNEPPDYRLQFGTAYGLSLGYNFNRVYSIGVEFIPQSREGQAYTVNTPDGQETQHINLTYTRIPVWFKYRVSQISPVINLPASVNYLMGVQYGRLNDLEIDPNLTNYKADDFSKNEWGLVFGMEYDVALGQHYKLSLGSRGSISTEMNTFPFFMSREFNTPVNFYLGINARFNYVFGNR